MAKMFPYPITQFNNVVEQDLYRRFERELDSSYTVFYSRRWTRTTPQVNHDIECDFIIVKDDAGIIIIEVKGGRWERINGGWVANGNPVLPNDDPITQIVENKYALIELLRSPSKWFHKRFPISYALALPDTIFPDELRMDGFPPILSNPDLPYLAEWMASAMQDCVRQNYPYIMSSEMLGYIKEVLLKDYTMFLNDILDINEKQLITLTEQQLKMDNNLKKLQRITVQGCAGSGKTLFAIRQAKRLAQTANVSDILFTCLNMELGEWLKKQTLDIKQRCTTVPFLVFCEEQLKKYNELSGFEPKTKEYYEELPYKLSEIIDLHDIKFDAIIVDEGQSFQDDWWIVLNQMLRDSAKSRFYIFYDDLQRIYQETKNTVPGEESPFELTVNIRNTAKIHKQAIKFLPSDRLPESNSVMGDSVRVYQYADETTMKILLRKALDDLIRDGRVSAKDIIILTAKSASSCLREGEKIGAYTLRDYETIDRGAVRFTTIQKFRGMERRVVIITEMDDEVKSMEQLNYLGCSRAKSLLIIMASSKTNPDFLNRLFEKCEHAE